MVIRRLLSKKSPSEKNLPWGGWREEDAVFDNGIRAADSAAAVEQWKHDGDAAGGGALRKHPLVQACHHLFPEKDTVTYEVQGRTKHYSAVPRESEVVVDSARSVLNRFFGGKIDKMVLYMAEAKQLTDQDVDDLYALVDKLKEEGRK